MTLATFLTVACLIFVNSSFSARTFDQETSQIREDLKRIRDEEQKDALINWLARKRIERDQDIADANKTASKPEEEGVRLDFCSTNKITQQFFGTGNDSNVILKESNSNLEHNFKYYRIDVKLFEYIRTILDSQNDSKIAADALAIFDSKFDRNVVASILPYRTQPECAKINTAIAALDYWGKPLVDPEHVPRRNYFDCYADLLFALMNEPMTVFSKYLGHFLDARDVSYIIMIFIQIDDREEFKRIYNSQHVLRLEDACRSQKHPVGNLLAVWAMGNRVDASKYPSRDEDEESCREGILLSNEQSGWRQRRTVLESVLMRHTIKYAQNSIRCYENHTGHQLVDDIVNKIKNKLLQNLYTSLVRYIKNDNDYLARILHDHSDVCYQSTLWIVVLTTRRTRDIEALDKAFRDAYEGVTLKNFILKCPCRDPIFKNMLAALIDPSHKPTYMIQSQKQQDGQLFNQL